MGSGKSSTGKILGERLGFRFLDTDQNIETRMGLKVREIFKDRGEIAFRVMESDLLEEVLSGERQVVAIGGGLWVDPDNRRRLLDNAWCVWLRVGASQAWDRVRIDLGERPLLADAVDPIAKIKELLKERTPLYGQAHAAVDTDGLTPFEVSEKVIQKLKETVPFDLPPLP